MNFYALSGFSLIEVLVSLLLISFILLGFNSTEVSSMSAIRDAYQFNLANHQLNNITERLRILKQYPGIEQQVAEWNTENQMILPQGKGEVEGHFPEYTISIRWGEQELPCQQNQLTQGGCLTRHISL
jgi:prepilin-type N-terminal cleavage/methylation domain-containing protein